MQQPKTVKEAFKLGRYHSINGLPDGKDYDPQARTWDNDLSDAYFKGWDSGEEYRKAQMKNPLLTTIHKPKKKNSTVRINPLVSAEDLINRAYKEGLVDGKNHATKDSFYTKESPKELKLAYLDGYSKGKRENPKAKKKNSTVRINSDGKLLNSASRQAINNYVKGKAYKATIPEHLTPEEKKEWLAEYHYAIKQLREQDAKENPNRHYPRTPRGRPTKGYWWILDFYDSAERKIGTSIGQGPKEEATREAKDWVGLKYKKKLVQKVLLSGPYTRKPTKSTVRV